MDSLAAQRICNLLEHDLGVTLEPAALLGGTTLAQLQESLAVALGVAVKAPRIVAPGEVEPRDAAERLLARVVAEVLGMRPPGVTDDLRAAGLTAGAKREIAARVSRETGATLDAGTLFAVPTVEAAAETVRQADETEAASLVRPIRAGGPNPPVLLAHPAGGTTGVYKALAGLLDGSRPVFGLERLEGPVPARAAQYAQLIVNKFPGGGWVLGGWSFGGVLGYEVARQLSEAGHHPGLVVLLDAALPLPPGPGGEGEALAHRFAAFADYLERTYGRQVRLPVSDLLGLAEDEQFDLLTQRMTAAGLTDVLSPAILRHQRQSHEDTRALERYEPGKYDGPVLLYRTEQDTPWAVHDPRYQITSEGRGWDLLCPSLTAIPVDAHHLNLLDPPAVHTVAAHLRTLLASQGGPT